ncbi:MAG TPA: hypothetical protein VHZ78_04865 [Rhizomicrobium sp.]|jgi:hypothetical protein|nr:hypothetical protein [Rhizomicrobium sp.]
MKRAAMALLASLILPSAVVAAPMQVCRIKANIVDTDPNGANVRATPGGKVIATLKNKADWIEVTITGQSGDWYEISSALQEDSDGPHGDYNVFRGKGYVHKSTVGLSGLQGTASVYVGHDEKSGTVGPIVDGDQDVQLLGCWQDFYKIRIHEGTVWTKAVCLNERTTCP